MIDTNQRLADLLPRLRQPEWIALDTEADSLHAYPEKLCLVQLSLPDGEVLIDPLAGLDLKPLFHLLRGHSLIVHGADYDLRLLRRTVGFVPSGVFDTMESARLLGHGEVSLTALVHRHLGILLEKGPQKADWARRPLTLRMENYARNDTRYLKALADLLRAELKRKGRLEWARETCDRLVSTCAQVRDPDPDLVWRVKGCGGLDRVALGILRELWHWREGEAVAANHPPFFILPHERLVAIAMAASVLEPLEGLIPTRFSTRRRAGLLDAVNRGLALPPSRQPHPVRAPRRRTSETHRRRFETLRRKRDSRAKELGIDPALIGSRLTLDCLAQDWDQHAPTLMSWQRVLLE